MPRPERLGARSQATRAAQGCSGRTDARRRRLPRSLGVVAALVAMGIDRSAGALDTVADFGPNPGALTMRVVAPDADAPLPVVVALHGCRQDAAAFDDETGLLDLARRVPFVLVLPEQSRQNNERNCFNWFDAADNRRGQGEAASIAAMAEHAVTALHGDADRVFVLGLSGGGAMAVVMLAAEPERFAAGAAVAGLPYGCNRPPFPFDPFWYGWRVTFGPAASAVYACGIDGLAATDRDAVDWAGFLAEAEAPTPAAWPRLSIWFGSADETVDPANRRELVEQWTALHGLDAEPEAVTTVDGAERAVHAGADGEVLVEAWRLPGFPHAWPVDPAASPPCGRASAFVEPAGICASRRILAFFGLIPDQAAPENR